MDRLKNLEEATPERCAGFRRGASPRYPLLWVLDRARSRGSWAMAPGRACSCHTRDKPRDGTDIRLTVPTEASVTFQNSSPNQSQSSSLAAVQSSSPQPDQL